MQHEKIYLARIRKFMERLQTQRFRDPIPMQITFIHDTQPIPYGEIAYRPFREIQVGEEWGKTWDSAWFRFKGIVPESFQDREVVALIDIGAEGCVFLNDAPFCGLTNKVDWMTNAAKEVVPLFHPAAGHEAVELLVEAAANGLFGAGQKDYRIRRADIAWINRKAWTLDFDLRTLLSLAESLPEKSPRRAKLVRAMNEVCNTWDEGKGMDACLVITQKVLKKKAHESTMTAYSIGHAHIDLAWLWHIGETKRKGGRTFATALLLMDEYPEYKFGASQPQLYQWMKEDYPQLYERIKTAIREGRWECQGAMWVEADMNLTGGESLVRQCLYGRKFYREEFGLEVNNLWLPDVFGYSAALPQILRKCGVDFFMTQKISWNETNLFPHHTFRWFGIDGTPILTHFLPTNDYNLANLPQQMIASEERFAQSDIADEFLNLYGIGDGGGGPSREHIELGLRQQNLEGVPKFKFAFANDFFTKTAKIPEKHLPEWHGELYLELHRGTYTSQAKMKYMNRKLELMLRDVEMLNALFHFDMNEQLEEVWKSTLLHQFHDILPGSSIKRVYTEGHQTLEQNIADLQFIQHIMLTHVFSQPQPLRKPKCAVVFNTLSWERTALVKVPYITWHAYDSDDRILPSTSFDDDLYCLVPIPSCGYETIHFVKPDEETPLPVQDYGLRISETQLENELISVSIAEDGTISSIRDKSTGFEYLSGSANRLLLWEDVPNNWEAWDINHFYRENQPCQAELLDRKVIIDTPLFGVLELNFRVGISSIRQRITLQSHSKLIEVENTVDWKESQKMLRVSADTSILAAEASFEIQYGTLRRPVSRNSSWEQAKFEVPGHRFADLSQPDHGFAILNDCKYGYSVEGGCMELNLLRSPGNPDPDADRGTHQFIFAYYPHEGDLYHSDTLKQAHELNSEVLVHGTDDAPERPNLSFFSLDGGTVKLEAVKNAENGEGIILRFYETQGCTCHVKITLAEEYTRCWETSMLEENLQEITWRQQVLELSFSPYEIRTFRLQ